MKTLVRISLVFILVWILARSAVYMLPGDPADFLVHDSLVQMPVEKLRARMDLPATIRERIFSFPRSTSLITDQSVMKLTSHSFFRSLGLTFFTLLFTAIFSISLLWAAFVSERWKNRAEGFSVFFASFPLFLLSPLLLILLSVKLEIFPLSHNPVLPALTLSLYLTGFWYRTLSTKILAYLPHSAVAGARARGLSESEVFFFYLLYPCMGSLMGFLGTQIGTLFNGSVIVEIIFQWNGLGHLITDAVLSRDYPVIEVGLMWVTLIALLCQQLGYAIQRRMEPKLR